MSTPRRPHHVVVMGIAGSGKTTIATALGRVLGAEVIDGDAHHPAANVAKMSAGVPLSDADRRPWLETLAAMIADRDAAGSSTVLACSALRRQYRDVLRSAVPTGSMSFVQLDADEDVVLERMERRDHFMPTALLGSQLQTLEPLQADEAGVRLDAGRPVDEVVADALTGLRGPTD